MKRIICMMLVIFSISVFSQTELKVESFKQSMSDISARTNQREDPEGEVCALVKVQLPHRNAQFEGNIIGEITFKTNEYWVYMPQKSNQLVIKLQDCTPLKVDFNNYGIPSLESKGTYELCVIKEASDSPQLYNEGLTALAKNDIVTAIEKLEKAYDAGYAPAAYELGQASLVPYHKNYEENPNSEESYKEAYGYYKKAAEKGLPEAQYALGKLLLEMQSLEQGASEKSIWDYIKKAADNGVKEAQYLMLGDNQWCKDSANKGVAIAQFGMGLRFDEPLSTEEYPMIEAKIESAINYSIAASWYQKAAENGLDVAQWRLGEMYARGLGVEKDVNKALLWREKAAEQGRVLFQLIMAMSYNYGEIANLAIFMYGTSEMQMSSWGVNIPQEPDKADYWLRKVSNHELNYREKDIMDCNSMYSDAMYILAEQLEKRREYGKAIYWYQRVGEKEGDEFYQKYALGALGRIFMEGLGVKKDYSKAKLYFERGSDSGSEVASCYLGIIYRDGLGVEKNYDKAIEYFMLSLKEDDNNMARYELGNLYLSCSEYDKALMCYKASPRDTYDGLERKYSKIVGIDEYGSLLAYKRGIIYHKGLGVKKDKEQGIEYLRWAASRGCEKAINELKEMSLPIPPLIIGKRENEITNDVFKWYIDAAEQGNKETQYQLGYIYYIGDISTHHLYDGRITTERNYDEARRWFIKAAEQGSAKAQNMIGMLYYHGKGVPLDYSEAVKWFRKAAEQSDATAQNNLGNMYYIGKGVEKDYKEAVMWYHKAAEAGKAEAQLNLGQMYYFGYGVPQNNAEAAKWYRKAAEQGDTKAKAQLQKMGY